MKNLIVTLKIFLLMSAGYHSTFAQVSQEWVKRYNGVGNVFDEATSVAVDNSGNVYVTGSSPGNGTDRDYATIKYNSYGDTLWVRRYNGTGNQLDQATSLSVDGSGNVFVTGSSIGIGTNNDYATIKYNSNGDSLWVRRYNGPGNHNDYAISIAVDGSGNVYVTGHSTGITAGYDYATIKYNSNGDSLWVRRYNGGDYDFSSSLTVDASGNVYVTGSSFTSGSRDHYATIKYSSNGNLLWVRSYSGGNTQNAASDLAVDGSGNVYVTGRSAGIYGTFNDYATIKYNSNGDSLWVRRHNGEGNYNDEATSLAVDGSGNVYVTGSVYSGNQTGYYDYATIKYNSNGDLSWVKKYSGPGNDDDKATSLAVDGSGNVYVTGYSSGPGTVYNYATIKYNSNGDSLWVQIYNGPGNSYDYARSITVDDSGNVYVTGYSEGNGTSYDYATIKYSQLIITLRLTALIEGFYDNVINKMIRDTVRVYLRNTTLPYGIVDSSKTVLDSTGNGTLNFFNASNSASYYIVIEHRNSIETWSSGGNIFLSNDLTYNFTTAASKAYGNNLALRGVKYCIYSGDADQDGSVDLTDLSLIDNAAFSFISGYVNIDVNGDNFVDLTDLTIADNNAYNFVSKVTP